MMRRLGLFGSCCAVVSMLACAPADDAATTDTAAGVAATTPTTINLADVAGRWTVRAVPETGDTTPVVTQLDATGDTSGWMMTMADRPPVPTRVVLVDADSIVTENGPYESILRKGVQVTTRGVWRMQDGKLVGTTVARYQTSGADSVLRLRTEATRTP